MKIKQILTAGTIALIAGSAHSAKLTLNIENVLSDKGTINVALYNLENADKFPSDEEGRIMFTVDGVKQPGLKKPAKVGTVTFEIDLPAGEYAVAGYQDINENDELDKVPFVGLPTEPYGFSQNARGAFGPATFGEASFTVEEGGSEHSFDVQ